MVFKIKKPPTKPGAKRNKFVEARISLYDISTPESLADIHSWSIDVPKGYALPNNFEKEFKELGVEPGYDHYNEGADSLLVSFKVHETAESWSNRKRQYATKLAEYEQWCVDFAPLIEQELEDEKVRAEIKKHKELEKLLKKKEALEAEIEGLES